MQKINILMLNYEFPPLGGGAANATLEILKQFSNKENFEIDLVTSSTSNFKIEKFSQNITIHYLNINKKGDLHFQSNKDLITYSIKSLIYSRKLLKQKKFHLTHAFFSSPCGFIALLLKKPYIVSLRGSDVPFYSKRYKFLDTIILKHLSKIVWKKSKAVIANSSGLKELALKSSPNQEIKVITNGVDITTFSLKTYKKNNKLKVMSQGRLIERKGLSYLIEAIKDLPVSLVIVGEGPLRKQLEEISKDTDTKLLGNIPHSEMPKTYADQDVFVLPSLNEGMSNAILEAMATGLPIITTDTGGTSELIKENGFIVPQKDSQAIKEKLKEFLNNETLLKNMGMKSRIIAEKMSWKNVADQYEEIYQNVRDHRP